jgi:hypothetical protein
MGVLMTLNEPTPEMKREAALVEYPRTFYRTYRTALLRNFARW